MNSDLPHISIDEQLKGIPENPGVYRYFDVKGKLLYIGKAKNLKSRVKSYFVQNRGHSYRIGTMVKQIADIQFTVTNSEIEALTLENNLIKEHQPKYNILLKDGKTYPYICIKHERFPRVFPTRKRFRDGSEYFGPFTSVSTMNALLDLFRKNYKLRTCNFNLSSSNVAAGKFKVCLEYQIGNCLGPCEGKQEEDSYHTNIQEIRRVLKGQIGPLLREIESAMMTASENLEFEKAEQLRQKLEKFRAYKRKNTVASDSVADVEVLTIDRLNQLAIINHFKVVTGAIISAHTYEFRPKNGETDAELLQASLERLAMESQHVSNEVITNEHFEFGETDEFDIRIPQRGDKKKLVELSLKNCRVLLEEKVWKQNFKKDPYVPILEQLQKDLYLQELPDHIECFDNSNFQGAQPVASLVVFKNAKPSKKDYRHFKIKTVEGPDDFASMEEIVYRRYKRLLDENLPLPKLVVIDGGKGQLSSAAKSLRELDLISKVPVIGIAKKLEEIYVLNDPVPLHLDKRSTSLKLIQQLRNEAHRFAITFHRDLRSKNTLQTKLTHVEGIGAATASRLLGHFRSVKKIKMASEEEIASIIGKVRAKRLVEARTRGEF